MSLYFLIGMILCGIAVVLTVIAFTKYGLPSRMSIADTSLRKLISLRRKSCITYQLSLLCCFSASMLMVLDGRSVSWSLVAAAIILVLTALNGHTLWTLKKMKAKLRTDEPSDYLDEDPWVDCSFPESPDDCLRKLRKHIESKQKN